MITRITGLLIDVQNDAATLQMGGLEYHVLIPEFVRRQLQGKIGESVSLHTIHYLDGNPAHGRLVPRLVGFLNTNEREFFELFCSVDGVGAKKALRAMVRPVREVAEMIEEQDNTGLSSLPGIGAAMAERIVAKLRRKVPKFALMVAVEMAGESGTARDVISDAYGVLRSLGHSESDARKLIEPFSQSKKKYTDVNQVIQEVYARHRQSQPS
jgi:holliday junction DNA helicase RuvA